VTRVEVADVVHEDVDRVECLRCGSEQVVDGVWVGDVSLHSCRLDAALTGLRCGRRRCGFAVTVVYDDVRAAVGKREQQFASDASSASGDECGSAGQIRCDRHGDPSWV